MTTLICSYCKEEKSIEEFPYYEKKQWKICRDCKRKKSLDWHYANREHVLKLKKEWNTNWYSDPSNRELAKKRQREYYHDHKEECGKRGKEYRSDPSNKEKIKQRSKQYMKDNPKGFRRRNAERRARKRNAITELWTHDEIAQNGIGVCPYCGKEIGLIYNPKTMHIDHIIPLSRGGSNLKENLEPTCCFCNLSKHDKTKEEFLNERQG
jgi:5-methylcytosine-specific restriction endonuclease McrA